MNDSSLTFEKFVEYIKEHILDDEFPAGEEPKVVVEKYKKSNDIETTGLVICTKDSSAKDFNASPMFNLEGFYQEEYLLKGLAVEQIINIIRNLYLSHKETFKNMDPDNLYDLEKCRDKIVPRLFNSETNEELLKSIPHIYRFGELTIGYAIIVRDDKNIGACKVNNDMLKAWNISKEELHEIAMENLRDDSRNMVLPFEPMFILMSKEGQVSNIPEEMYSDWPFLITRNIPYGASLILRKEIIADIADKMKSDVYLTFLSDDEIVAVHEENVDSLEELSQTVFEINRDINRKENVLSNCVYKYTRETGVIFNVTNGIEMEVRA